MTRSDEKSPTGVFASNEKTGEPHLRASYDRERFARNVLANWIGHFVFIGAGFVLPRLISDRIGQAQLGVWDFAWSVVGYLNMLTLGITSSTNRYVAKYRAEDRMDALNAAVSACWVIFLAAGAIAFLVTLGFCVMLPGLFGEALGAHVTEAQWVVFVLGASAALEMPLAVYNGVITGTQRYALVNVITSGCQILAVVTIIIALMFGAGLFAASLIMLCKSMLVGVITRIAAYRVCDGLRISHRLLTRPAVRTVVGFGGKTFLVQLSGIFVYQTTNMLILYALGPAALARYMRPMALVMHARKLLQQFARVLTPTASDMQARGHDAALRQLLTQMTRYSLALALPMVIFLSILGGPLLRAWMGEGYDEGLVLAILAVGHLAVLTHLGTVTVLGGMNAHGRVGVALVVVAALTVGVNAITLGVFGWGLAGIAVGVGLTQTGAYGLAVPIIAGRVLGLPIRRYFRESVLPPVIANAPFAMALVLARYLGSPDTFVMLALGAMMGGTCLSITYWRIVLPERFKIRARRWLIGRT